MFLQPISSILYLPLYWTNPPSHPSPFPSPHHLKTPSMIPTTPIENWPSLTLFPRPTHFNLQLAPQLPSPYLNHTTTNSTSIFSPQPPWPQLTKPYTNSTQPTPTQPVPYQLDQPTSTQPAPTTQSTKYHLNHPNSTPPQPSQPNTTSTIQPQQNSPPPTEHPNTDSTQPLPTQPHPFQLNTPTAPQLDEQDMVEFVSFQQQC